ncbi:hypothetical protein [Variovorax terrae]|uniref:Uncharacterized protein n=1 Tax=Variovorax terrae TaxID=2923278 RepID=A0A9X2AQK6_9BURK|nr:hypothetical protein [Variovorax terrae]MCJ0766115.1 hypothetical protein [Variovorax terrae]
MPIFEIKQVEVPLFGVVEASDQSAWLEAFAAATTTIAIEVDAAALNLIANDLELDAEGLAADAERYVGGRYRAKARGMGGSRLGDLGEVLTFLVNSVAGREVVRVVSWRAGTGQAVKGTLFPQPDFIIKDASGLAALEVKSTEAFDFVHLRDATKHWTWLQPCSSVRGRREQALQQLAFVGGILTPQQHSLVVKGGTVVPFPVGKGVAAAVVAVDGRMNELRSDPKYKTPPACRQANRDCWSCLPKSCHFALVTMPNAPGMLSLGGAASDGSMRWLRAYRRWSQALAAHDLLAVRASVGILVETLAAWLDGTDILEADVLRGFWGSYLRDAMRSRGFEVEVPGQFGNLNHLESGFEWTPALLAEPASRETSADDITRSMLQDQEPAASFMMSARLRRNDRDADSISVRGFGDFVEFHLMSETWWTEGSVDTVENASSIATRLLSFALEASGWPISGDGGPVPLRKVTARVGDDAVHLGWASKPATPGSSSWRSWMRGWPIWFDLDPWPPWPMLLFLGDPRIRLRVMPDGRADLRVLRTLLRSR